MVRLSFAIGYTRIATIVIAVWLAMLPAPVTDAQVMATAHGVDPRTMLIAGAVVDVAVDRHTGHAFVATILRDGGQGAIEMVDVRRGTILHATTTGLNPSSIAIDERSRRVFVSCSGPLRPDGYEPRGRGSITVLDADTGRLVRTERGVHYPDQLAVDEASGRVFVLNLRRVLNSADQGLTPVNRDTLGLLDARDGRLLRVLAPGAPGVGNAPSLGVDEALGRAFVLLNDGTVRALDATTGTTLWTTRIPGGNQYDVYTLFIDRSRHRIVVSADQMTDPAFVVLMDGRTGKILVNEGVISFGAARGTVGAIDGTHGRAVFIDTYPGSGVYSSESAYVLDTRTGGAVGTIALGAAPQDGPGPKGVSVDEGPGRAYIKTTRGLTVVDVRDGHILRRVPVGADSSLMVSDGPARSLLLLANVGHTTTLTILDTSRL